MRGRDDMSTYEKLSDISRRSPASMLDARLATTSETHSISVAFWVARLEELRVEYGANPVTVSFEAMAALGMIEK